jgi:hypothetical protein
MDGRGKPGNAASDDQNFGSISCHIGPLC